MLSDISFADKGKDSEHGWLSRSGEFFPCNRETHTAVAYLLLKKDEAELERMGFVRVQYNEPVLGWKNYDTFKYSVEQARFLAERGYDINEEDIRVS